jgi:hypothetical protein
VKMPRKKKTNRKWCPNCHRHKVTWDTEEWKYQCHNCQTIYPDKKTLLELLKKEGLIYDGIQK